MRPIIDQTGKYVYSASKVVAKNPKLLSKGKYFIDETLTFPVFLKIQWNSTTMKMFRIYWKFIHDCSSNKNDWLYNSKNSFKGRKRTFCKKSIFTKLVKKLPQERAFSINNILMKQFNGYPMDGLISVVFSYIYVCKMEEDIVIPANRVFYKWCGGESYVKRKKIMKQINSL